MNIDSLPVTHQATVPESYLDAMGHMNVMWYTHLFDQATWRFFASLGLWGDAAVVQKGYPARRRQPLQ
jgi:acyl-CoA thioester hydrolase